MNIEKLIKTAAYGIFLITLSYCISLFTAWLPSGIWFFIWFLTYLGNGYLVVLQIKLLDKKNYAESFRFGFIAFLLCLFGYILLLMEVSRMLSTFSKR